MNQIVKAPLGRRTGIFISIFRAALRTQLGKRIAFFTGLRGFNRIVANHLKYIREFSGEKLSAGERIITGEDGIARVYSAPRLVALKYNSRVDKGAALQASLMSGQALGSISSPNVPVYIALSPNSLTPAKGDTTLSGETSVSGLGRAAGTIQNYVAPSVLDGAASYDIYKEFTLSGSNTTIVSTALFDASSVGNMFAEANLSSSAALATNDILQITWTINL